MNRAIAPAGGNRWNLNDPKVDDLASRQQTELDTDKRKQLLKQIWDYDLDQAYHPVVGSGSGFYVYQSWLRGIRFGQASPNSNSSYYNWGSQVETAWLDK